MARPKVFIGSSTESLNVAKALQANLHPCADVQLWTQGVFGLSDYTLDALLAGAPDFDFAVFVFGADDIAEIRGQRYLVARDNVVFEAGIFVGKIGRQRTFIVAQNVSELQLPSDLKGITVASFSWPPDQPLELGRLRSVLGAVSTLVETSIARDGTREETLKPLSAGMVFLALLLRDRRHSVRELAKPFRNFQDATSRLGSRNKGEAYSEKAAKYGCQCLQALGLADSAGGDEFELTKLGLALLETDKLHARFSNVFDHYPALAKP
jgi:hypothetical protein